MAYSDFRNNLKRKQAEAKLRFDANSDEAWAQIRGLVSKPAFWIGSTLAVLLILAGIFAVQFLGTVRAPELGDKSSTVSPVRIDNLPSSAVEIGGEEPPEEIDDSNTEQPLVSGARKENCYTFLLFGTDKEGTNTDTIMVVSYDVANQKLDLMSIPRDTMVNVPWDVKKINSVYGMRGLSGFQKQIGKLIGFVPDFYVKIDLAAFVQVVDLIGGVEFDVPVPMHYHDPYQGLNIDLNPGLQTLNGEQAMGLVRFRKSDRSSGGKVSGYDDTGRVATQQAFLKAMFKKCLQIRNWTKITSYVEIFEQNVDSDLTLGNMLWFARQAMDLGEDGFNTVTAPGNYYASAWSRSIGSQQSYVTLYGSQMVKLVNERFNPYLKQITMGNLDIMSVNRDGSVSSSTGYVADGIAAVPPEIEPDGTEVDEPPEGSDMTDESEDPSETGETTDPVETDEPDAEEPPTEPDAEDYPAEPETDETPE